MRFKLSRTLSLLITVTVAFLVIVLIFFAGVFAGIQNTYEYRFKKDTVTNYNIVFKDTTVTLKHFMIEIDTIIKRDTVYIHKIIGR